MADFQKIVQWLLYIEDDHKEPGKIVNEGDGGGFTRLGLTSKNFSSFVPDNFFTDLPFAEAVTWAKDVYKTQYWNHFMGDAIQSDTVAAPLLSFAVNRNVKIAVKALQAALSIEQDGVLGPETLAELNSKNPDMVAKLFRANWENFYHTVVELNPGDERFLQGWINRVNFPYPSTIPGIYA